MSDLPALTNPFDEASEAFGKLVNKWVREGKMTPRRHTHDGELEFTIESLGELWRNDPEAAAEFRDILSTYLGPVH